MPLFGMTVDIQETVREGNDQWESNPGLPSKYLVCALPEKPPRHSVYEFLTLSEIKHGSF